MTLREQIPERFWGMFQSQNRYIYIESLLLIYDEYLYNDYFLTKDTCIQLLTDHFSNRSVDVSADAIVEDGTGAMSVNNQNDDGEPVAAKILNRLLFFGWLRKVEDYSRFKTNIVIPDYASMFLDVFQRLAHPEENEADLYIQNIYTNVYSFYHDRKSGVELLKTARINISRLNRSLQDLLHNMDEFFARLLAQETYEKLLTEHLEVFVEDAVNRKYGVLKTGDNFYFYKNDIKTLLRAISEDEERKTMLARRMTADGKMTENEAEAEIEELLEACERGISNMEKRISYIDSEYSKYIKATVSRLEYLLNNDDNTRGLVTELLNLLGRPAETQAGKDRKTALTKSVAEKINFHDLTVVSQDSFYKKRSRRVFEETLTEDVEQEELTRDQVLRMNKISNRYSADDIEQFIFKRLEAEESFETSADTVADESDFELLILAYDYAIRRNSPFKVELSDRGMIETGKFRYPKLVFHRK